MHDEQVHFGNFVYWQLVGSDTSAVFVMFQHGYNVSSLESVDRDPTPSPEVMGMLLFLKGMYFKANGRKLMEYGAEMPYDAKQMGFLL